MVSYAILIDAGFVKRRLGSREHPVTAEHIASFIETVRQHRSLNSMRLHRAYFYDSPPLTTSVPIPLGEGETMDFSVSDLAKNNARLLQTLASSPFISIRRGELAFRGWRIRNGRLNNEARELTITRDDLQPNVMQKGVDMRIGLDIASLTLKKQVQVIVLVTADTDFVPAMKFARREGAQLFLVPLGITPRPSLVEHADLVLDIPRQQVPNPIE